MFSCHAYIKSGELCWAMRLALEKNRPQFVSLLLENGVSLKDFLKDEETLCELYREMPSCIFLRKLAKRVKPPEISMTHVSNEVRHLLGSFTKALYPPTDTPSQIEMPREETPTADTPQEEIPLVSLFIRHLRLSQC